MELDVDKLIQLMHERPPLWDKGLDAYKDRLVKEKCWQQIGEEMEENWDVLTQEEREGVLARLRSKWKNIRDQYVKLTKKGKYGDSAKKAKKYIWGDALDFLNNSAENRKSWAMEEEEEEASAFLRGDPLDVEESSAQQSHKLPESRLNPHLLPASPSFQKLKKKEKMTTFQKELLQKLDRCSDNIDDPDFSFLLSVLPYMQELNSDEKLDFQQHVLSFFQQIRQRRRNPLYPAQLFPQSPQPQP